jgi:hypothetical protein
MGPIFSIFFGSKETTTTVPVEEEEVPVVELPNWNSSFWGNSTGYSASGTGTSVLDLAKGYADDKEAIQKEYEQAEKEAAKKAQEEEEARQASLAAAAEARKKLQEEEKAAADQQQSEWELAYPAPIGRNVPCFIALWPDGNMAQCQVIDEGLNLAMCGMLPKESFLLAGTQVSGTLRTLLALVFILLGISLVFWIVYTKIIKPRKNKNYSSL